MKKLMICLVMLMMLCGCGSSDKTTACSYSEEGFNLSNEIVSDKEGTVKSVTYKSDIDFGLMGIDDDELITTVAEQVKSVYEEIEGVTYSYELADGVLSETTVVDFTKADHDKLIELSFVEESLINNGLALEDMLKIYTDQGFECK